MKTLINGGNIWNSILTGIRIFISSKEAIPYKFIGIRMFVNRLPIWVNSFNSIQIIWSPPKPYIIMRTKIIFRINSPDTICLMRTSNASDWTFKSFILSITQTPLKHTSKGWTETISWAEAPGSKSPSLGKSKARAGRPLTCPPKVSCSAVSSLGKLRQIR